MSFAYKISGWNRRRKWNLFLEEFSPINSLRVLDVGFSDEEYSSTDNFIEKHYPYPEMLTALGVCDTSKFRQRYPDVTVVQYDGGTFPFKDKEFDVCWSNAVIEHVGKRNAQVQFLKEIRRVSRRAFVTTPNRYFPVETHTRTPFLHYLPKELFDKYLCLVGKEWASKDYMYLLSHRDVRELLSDAGITDYRIHRNRLLGFTLDFAVIFPSRAFVE
jgi:SAM-dependent methyltransferase